MPIRYSSVLAPSHTTPTCPPLEPRPAVDFGSKQAEDEIDESNDDGDDSNDDGDGVVAVGVTF